MANKQQLITTPYQPPAETTNSNLPAVDEENLDPNSIWNQPKFPAKTKPLQFTPSDLKTALIEYSQCDITLTEHLRSKGIDRNTFFTLIGLYPEIAEAYSVARSRKADVFGEKLTTMWEELPQSGELYVYDREGNKSLSTAAAAYLKAKSDNLLRIAQFHETKSYVPASKQETINRNLNIGVQLTGNLPADYDISTAAPGDLVDILKGRKRV
jgi:hypothetical protein